MKILGNHSMDEALADERSAGEAIRHAIRFTKRYQALQDQPAPLREAELLGIQFPSILRLPEKNDLFAGRIRYGLVGFSPEPVGLGYACFEHDLAEWLERGIGDSEVRQQASWLLQFWKENATQVKVRQAYPPALEALLPSDKWTEDSGVAFPLYRMAGSVLDYGRLLELGIGGLQTLIRSYKSEVTNDLEGHFYEGALRSLEVLQASILYYIAKTEDPGIRKILEAILEDPPATFRQAIQLFWLYALHAGTWNYGRMDVYLGPFLEKDLANNELPEEEAFELVLSLWRLMEAYSNQYNNRVIIGGKGRPDEKAADRFALLAIEATRRLRLNQPQLSLRFHEKQDPALWDKAITAIGEGCTFPMLYNDDVNIPAVARAFSVDPSMASEYTPFGCGEYVLGPYGAGSPNGVINLLKALEIALHEGRDPVTGERVLNTIPPLSRLDSFEALWGAYKEVVETYIQALARQEKIEYEVASREASFLFISILTNDCLEKGQSVYGGGARYLGGTVETYGNTNAADSLHAINETVFRKNQYLLSNLVEALDKDFEGRETIRKDLQAITKYGNDEGLADAMAQKVHDHICNFTREQAADVGLHSYLVVIINNSANTILGKQTGASMDGRGRGEPMANGNNPSPGADISGVTAFLNSLGRLKTDHHAGSVQNMKFAKDWFGDNRPKFEALLKAWFRQGGSQAMITVVSRDDLEAAMREPEKWGHLMVRVGGFSIRFVDLPEDVQREVLQRTLH